MVTNRLDLVPGLSPTASQQRRRTALPNPAACGVFSWLHISSNGVFTQALNLLYFV